MADVDVQFGRSRSVLLGSLAAGILMLAASVAILDVLLRLVLVCLMRPGTAYVAALFAVPMIAFAGMIWLLVWGIARGYRDRNRPLVTLGPEAITLHRTNPVSIDWPDISDAVIESGGRAGSRLRLVLTDLTVREAGGPGRVISLGALEGRPADLLAAIRSRLDR